MYIREYDYYRDCAFQYDSSMSDHIMVFHILSHCHHHTVNKTGNAKSTFISVMKTIPPHKTSLVGRILVALCVFSDEGSCLKDCVEAMLNGETGHDVDVNFVAPAGVTAIYVAAILRKLELIEILLKHGANADIRGVTPREDYVSQDGYHFDGVEGWLPMDQNPLPIENAFSWRFPYEGLMDPFCWTSDAENTLVIILSRMSKEDIHLKVIGLLVANTREIGQLVHRIVKEGEAANLAFLLLAAREKVMSLAMLEGKECSASEGGMKLSEYIMTEIATITDEESRLMGNEDWHIMSQHLEHKKKKLTFALMMLEVFERAGDGFDRYLRSKHGNGTKEDVAGLLKDAGCNIDESMKDIHAKTKKFIERKFQSTAAQMSPCSQADGLYKKKQEPITSVQYQQRMSFSTCVPRGCAAKATSSALGFKFPTAGKAQLIKTTKGIGHCKTGFVSNKQWFSFAFSLKRFIRRV